jgi:hypothetical protein
VRALHQRLGDFAFHTRQADVEASLQEVIAPVVPRSTSASIAASAGSLTFILAATIFIALKKQADQPAANSCSGLVPVPGNPGDESLMSRRPSDVRDAPSRPPVV